VWPGEETEIAAPRAGLSAQQKDGGCLGEEGEEAGQSSKIEAM
jgi:hypothetical protein